MSSILSEQNLHTLRRRNIGRRCWPSLPVCPAAPARPRPPLLLPPPPPPPNVLRPFIACPPHRGRSDHRGRRPRRLAVLHPAADPRAAHVPYGGAVTSPCACRASARRPPGPRRCAPPGGG